MCVRVKRSSIVSTCLVTTLIFFFELCIISSRTTHPSYSFILLTTEEDAVTVQVSTRGAHCYPPPSLVSCLLFGSTPLNPGKRRRGWRHERIIFFFCMDRVVAVIFFLLFMDRLWVERSFCFGLLFFCVNSGLKGVEEKDSKGPNIDVWCALIEKMICGPN